MTSTRELGGGDRRRRRRRAGRVPRMGTLAVGARWRRGWSASSGPARRRRARGRRRRRRGRGARAASSVSSVWLMVPSDGARDDEERQPEARGQVGHVHAGAIGTSSPPAPSTSRSRRRSETRRRRRRCARGRRSTPSAARGHLGRGRQAEAVGAHQRRIERAAGGGEQALAVVAVAGLARLHHGARAGRARAAAPRAARRRRRSCRRRCRCR